MTSRLVLLAACLCATACAGTLIKPALSPARRVTDALLVLPGLGYNADAEAALRSLAVSLSGDGVDLYVPAYLSRSGLTQSRTNLARFIRDHRLDAYERLHVFAFIAGAWTLNPLLEAEAPANLATVFYDRSPLQERAPRVAAEELRFLAWLRYGSPVFDIARTPYLPLTSPSVRVALIVETTPTSFVTRHAHTIRGYGPLRFECDAFLQRYDDCLYLHLNHDEIYLRFAEVWPQLLAFIRSGRFTSAADRRPPAGDPLSLTSPVHTTGAK